MVERFSFAAAQRSRLVCNCSSEEPLPPAFGLLENPVLSGPGGLQWTSVESA